MTKPTLNRQPTSEELEKITETKNGQKVVGKASANGKTLYFLADGSELIEDNQGNVLEQW